jgi:hypothetical protein
VEPEVNTQVEPVPAGISEAGGTTTITTTTGAEEPTASSDGYRVKVVDVFRNGAQVEVEGTVYTLDEGERFASKFQLVSSSGECATMLFGDDEFTLCEGEEILK